MAAPAKAAARPAPAPKAATSARVALPAAPAPALRATPASKSPAAATLARPAAAASAPAKNAPLAAPVRAPAPARLQAPARPAPSRASASKPPRPTTRSFYWSELRVGDDLPLLVKPAIDRVQIARYAGASGDFNRLQLDEPYAHGLGFRGVFAPGALAMGFVGQLLTSWLRRGHVRRLSARFVKIIWPGDVLTCHGRISELRKEKGACYADLELWAENQKGELVLRGQATCELYETPASAPSALGSPFAAPRAAAPASRPPPRRS